MLRVCTASTCLLFCIRLAAAAPPPPPAADDPWLGHLNDIVQPDEMNDVAGFVDAQIRSLSSPIAGDHTTIQLVHQGWGVLQSGWSVNHRPLQLNGKVFPTGLGTHVDSQIISPLPPPSPASAVRAASTTRPRRASLATALSSPSLLGTELWHSPTMTARLNPARFDVTIQDHPSATLSARSVGDGSYTPADWVNLHVTRADNSMEELGQRHGFFDGDDQGIGFTYDGVPSTRSLRRWPISVSQLPTDRDVAAAWRITRTDPTTRLACMVDIKRYATFPVVEWTLHLKNTGSTDTPILDSIHSMDVSFPLADDTDASPPTTPVLLHHNIGDHAAADSYQPLTTPLGSGDAVRFAPDGGRPTDHAWPYFNIEFPSEHRGVIAAVGWPGQWEATIARPAIDGDELRLTAGQQLTHLRLHPGEEIRAPLSVLLFYRGDVDRGQNLWRRWMLADNVPRRGGQLPRAIHSVSLGLYQSQKSETDGIALYTAAHAGLTDWWMDAGWYPCKDQFWWNLSSWDPDQRRFPHGIAAVSDDAHARGLKTILWFEPERAHLDGWLWKNRPQWLLSKRGETSEKLLNLGNPQAWQWLVDKIDSVLTSQHIDTYRQDCNFEPLDYWRQNDAPDRQGITEIRHVEGYLAFWDELHRRHPDLLIDTCASGGRRLDLETLRRSIPLWRSDDNSSPEDEQSHTAGIAQWISYYGSGAGCSSAYAARSIELPFLSLGGPDRADSPRWQLYRRESENWQMFRDDLLGDFYPLLPATLDHQSWMAWQFDRPELGRGVVQAFRRPESPYTAVRLPLHGLDVQASYAVTNLDDPEHPQVLTGRQLMGDGLEIQMSTAPAAALFTYQKQPSRRRP